MEVIAFVGPSGTGKSHRALVVAHEHQIPCIIDDGILIHNNRIVAGSSAKKEESKLKAVRRAIFEDAEQVESVRSALDRINPTKLLILGTSDNMVKKIAKALAIPKPSQFINIEDIATPDEIKKARYARIKEGKHIIPVPTMELRPHFKGYLIDPLRSIFRRSSSKKQMLEEMYEKSVIRPAFSYYGELTFSDTAISSLIYHASGQVAGVVKLNEMEMKKSKKGTNALLLELVVSIEAGRPIKPIMTKLQRAVRHELEYSAGMSIERMEMTVKHQVAGRYLKGSR